MEKQGLSLFEGKDCLEIDPNLINHEEDDEEDQKRRNEEVYLLGKVLINEKYILIWTFFLINK
jgi:hypothetical protein